MVGDPKIDLEFLPHRGCPARAVPARRGDDRGPPVGGGLDEHPASDATRTVHQHGLPGPHLQGVGDRLVGGERRDRQRGGGGERYPRRYDGDVLGGSDEPPGPGALLAQRKGMHSYPVACLEPVGLVPGGSNEPGGLDAQRHRWPDAEVPASGAGGLIPVAHPGRMHVE